MQNPGARLLPVGVACAAPVLHVLWIRPRMLTWGATRDELGVDPAWRRRGLASRLHEALLTSRSEPRVVLWVRADAPAARATYAHWGYRLLGSVPDRPPYQVMCLDRGPAIRPEDRAAEGTPPAGAPPTQPNR